MRIELNASIADILAAALDVATGGRVTVGAPLPPPPNPRSRPRKQRTEGIGHFLKRLREHNGWTQAEVGVAVGLNRATISNYETGALKPSDFTKQDIIFHLVNDPPPQRSPDPRYCWRVR